MLALPLKLLKKERKFRQHHCCLTPPLQGNPANIRMNLILPETRVIAIMRYIFAADSVGLSSFKFLWWAPKTHVF